MDERDVRILEAMRTYGGSFVAALSKAAILADFDNFGRLKAAFPEYWARYNDMVVELADRREKGAENEKR